jgi:hypothetical protein
MAKTRSPNTSGAPRIGALTSEVQISLPSLGSRQKTAAKPVVTNSLPPYQASPPPNSSVVARLLGLERHAPDPLAGVGVVGRHRALGVLGEDLAVGHHRRRGQDARRGRARADIGVQITCGESPTARWCMA